MLRACKAAWETEGLFHKITALPAFVSIGQQRFHHIHGLRARSHQSDLRPRGTRAKVGQR